ncbi:MAG: hypothetical protein HQL21_03225 [Candidatus Omnitrophica bacterium]|nr:hypothetical protein [Candidatus Omnitrophota bacterium]
MGSITCITRQEFIEIKNKNKYWMGRWSYMREVVLIINEINPSSALEIGSRELPIMHGSDVMDLSRKYLSSVKYVWDATRVPWPMGDRHYDLVVALQVWEHLLGFQKEAFAEVMRVARRAILSFSYKWQCNPKDCHYNIDEAKIAEWTLNVKPVLIKQVGTRIIYYFDFDNQLGHCLS